MGHLIYGSGIEYDIEDRTLAHAKVAIGMKLRRGEAFFVSWPNPVSRGSGRVSIWLSPNIPLVFRFAGSRVPELNQTWVNVLHDLSNTSRGLVLLSEKEAEAYAAQRAQDGTQPQFE
ncbi:hypothetical protein GCM10009847_03590 [Leucobacter tardus]|uniref:DUF7882 domain-containing protein n=1 Tax=Leucobacter tardus TaxID=501483 RepID=A0A939QB94_9MICO|nr:hypothetical protein [Leucobacter tardus]MBO2988567.1 hypothetical protein [Leucobacter tardus]